MSNTLSEQTVAAEFLQIAIENFRELKMMGEKTFEQVTEEQLHWTPDEESNSIAVIVQHLYGNMRSRWTEFFTSDLEKPDRNRDGEFEARKLSKDELLALWQEGWGYVLGTMESLTPDQLLSTVRIRGVETLVIKAINRQVSHYAYHVGQIVYIAKHQRSAAWQTLSIARGKSKDYVPNPRTGK